MENTRVKINLKSGEIEFEGSEEFVQNQMDNLDAILDLIGAGMDVSDASEIDEVSDSTQVDSEDSVLNSSVSTSDLEVPGSFGEWMHKFNDSINDLEKALVTAYYVQSQSDKKDFKTLEVNKSLRDHGIKLSNPSQSLKKLETKKYLFQTRKEGPKIRFMRVSQDGINHLKSLLR